MQCWMHFSSNIWLKWHHLLHTNLGSTFCLSSSSKMLVLIYIFLNYYFFSRKIKYFSLCLYCFCAFFYDFLKFYLKPKLIIPKTIQYKLYVGTKKGLLQSKGKETVLNFSWIGLVGWPISGLTNLKFGWGSNGFEVHSWWMNLVLCSTS